MSRSYRLAFLCLSMVIILGCTTTHGIEQYDAKYTKTLAEKKANIGLANITVLHAGNFNANGMFGLHHAKLAARVAGPNGEADNRPTRTQAANMRKLEEQMTDELRERLAIELSPVLSFQNAKPMNNASSDLHLQQFIQRNRLITAIDVKLELTKQMLPPLSSRDVVKGTWRLLDPDGEVRMQINTLTELPVGVEIRDTRDVEYQTYYLEAAQEAAAEFSGFVYEAMLPSALPRLGTGK